MKMLRIEIQFARGYFQKQATSLRASKCPRKLCVGTTAAAAHIHAGAAHMHAAGPARMQQHACSSS